MKFKIAGFQMNVSQNKQKNIEKVENCIKELKTKEVDMVVLPEMFICPYQTTLFKEYSEVEGGETWRKLSKIAKKYHIYIIAGSVPENEDGKIYNTSYVFNREGEMIAKHRKIHLFDIDIKGGQYFKESDSLSSGESATVFETEFGKIGLCICYDLRFPELSRIMVDRGAKMIIVPAAFNMTTGPSHWDILFRTRALDNQVFTLGVAPARDNLAGYISWANSILVSPWGDIVNKLDENEDTLISEIDFDYVTKIREELPLLAHRRSDIYKITSKEK